MNRALAHPTPQVVPQGWGPLRSTPTAFIVSRSKEPGSVARLSPSDSARRGSAVETAAPGVSPTALRSAVKSLRH